MAEGNAAVLEPGTASEPEATTEILEESPESVLSEDTETDGSETGTDSDEASEEDDKEPVTLTREEHEKALKDVEARLTESFRQKTENAQKQAEDAANKAAFTQRVTESAKARSAQTYQQITNVIKDVAARRENGEEIDLSPQWLMGIAAQQADAAFWDQDAAYASAFDAYVAKESPDWRKPPEVSAAVERALHLPPSDPNRIPQLFQARMDVLRAAVREQIAPKLREEIEAEVRAELGAAKTTAAMKQNDAARAAQPKPTGVGSTGAQTRQDLSRLIGDPSVPKDKQRAAFEQMHGFKPDF